MRMNGDAALCNGLPASTAFMYRLECPVFEMGWIEFACGKPLVPRNNQHHMCMWLRSPVNFMCRRKQRQGTCLLASRGAATWLAIATGNGWSGGVLGPCAIMGPSFGWTTRFVEVAVGALPMVLALFRLLVGHGSNIATPGYTDGAQIVGMTHRASAHAFARSPCETELRARPTPTLERLRALEVRIAPRKHVTAEEELQNLNRRAAEVDVRMGRRRIQLAMQSCPSCIPHLCKTLDSLGYDDARIAKQEQVADSFQTVAAKERTKRVKEEQEEAANAETAAGDSIGPIDPSDMVSSTYWKLEAVSYRLLRDRILPAVDDQVLSAANLRTKLDRMGTDRAREESLRILEATAGIRSLPLVGKFRSWPAVRDFVSARASLRGRRALHLSLPPDWAAQGVFSLEGMDQEQTAALVKNRYDDRIVQIPSNRLPPFDDFAHLYIESNWSEAMAAVSSTTASGHEQDDMLKNLFPPMVMDAADDGSSSARTPDPKRARTGSPRPSPG